MILIVTAGICALANVWRDVAGVRNVQACGGTSRSGELYMFLSTLIDVYGARPRFTLAEDYGLRSSSSTASRLGKEQGTK